MSRFKRYVSVASILASLATCPPPCALAQEVAKRVAITQHQADQILDELKQIHALLEKIDKENALRAASPPVDDHVKLTVDDGYALGSHDAPVTLVEFTDYQCPYCRAFHKKAFVELKKSYIDTGKLRFISRDLPMEMHADAPMAAEAARCAGDQGKYWEIRESLFSNPASLNRETVLKYAGDLALNVETFRDCLDHEKYKAQIERDASDAASIGIDGTPTFVLGKSSGDTVEGIRLVGARPYASFEADIKKVLAEAP